MVSLGSGEEGGGFIGGMGGEACSWSGMVGMGGQGMVGVQYKRTGGQRRCLSGSFDDTMSDYFS